MMKKNRLQGNWNQFVKLSDQLEFLKDEEKANKQAIQRAESKLRSASKIMDMSQVGRRLDEVEKLLDAQERILSL